MMGEVPFSGRFILSAEQACFGLSRPAEPGIRMFMRIGL